MTGFIVAVFVVVYAGMVLGRFPGVRIDRTGVALLGAIALLAAGALDLDAARDAVDLPTIALLFSLMLVAAQLRLGGFFARVTAALAALPASNPVLLAWVVALAGLLSAVFTNDVVCLAAAPVLIGACLQRGLDPVPFLLALACASNVGSAATLIGNPQNMLVGQTLDMSFAGYLAKAGAPALLGLVATWAIIAASTRGKWHGGATLPHPARPRTPAPASDVVAFDRAASAKGLAIAAALFVAFLVAPWPREITALSGAAILLVSRQTGSARLLALVDWQLLVLFGGLFVVNAALAATGLPERAVTLLSGAGADPRDPAWLYVISAALSNAVSNVPAVMLLLPLVDHPLSGPILALATTLSGNLLIVGSIANIIVVDAAARFGVEIDWRRHARTGVPVTIVTLAIAAAWLAWRA